MENKTRANITHSGEIRERSSTDVQKNWIFQDEEYLCVVVPDEEKFLQRHEAKLMVGYDNDLWVDGKAV